jgi:hypothetical protein
MANCLIYQEFVSKYDSIIKGGILDFENHNIYTYLDKEFENELIINPNFIVWYIKCKLGKIRISSNSNNNINWEQKIEKILAGD